jgi:hypothetical protein
MGEVSELARMFRLADLRFQVRSHSHRVASNGGVDLAFCPTTRSVTSRICLPSSLTSTRAFQLEPSVDGISVL